MSLTEAVKTCLSKYADFSGRASRPEYWWFVVAIALVYLVLLAVTYIIVGGLSGLWWLAWGIWVAYVIATLVPSLAVLVRRLHDTGRSGWWWFIGLVPIVGFIVLVVFLVGAGDESANKYGEVPAA